MKKEHIEILWVFLIIIFFITVGRADQVFLNDGETYEGAIFQSDNNFIYMQLDVESIAKIPHQLVKQVFFRYADTVYLLDGSQIKCKLLEENFPDLRIVSNKGQQLIKLGNIKRYFYNNVDSLFAPNLPQTGSFFNNQVSLEFIEQPFRQSISITFGGGLIQPPASQWQENFLIDSSPLGASLQGQLDLHLIKKISVVLGYKYSEYGFTVQGDLDSKITSNFFHLGLNYLFDLDFMKMLDLAVGADIGFYNISGTIYSYSYRKMSLDNLSTGVAYHPHATLTAFVSRNLAVKFNLGYLVAQDYIAETGSDCQTEIIIPMSGVSVYAGISYLIPMNIW